jgi:hypothetical protein
MLSLNIVCHNEKSAKKKTLRTDFVVSASSLDVNFKKRRTMYTEDPSNDKTPSRRSTRLRGGGGKPSLLRPAPPPGTAKKPPPPRAVAGGGSKVHPVEDNGNGDDPSTVDMHPEPVPVVAEPKLVGEDNESSNATEKTHINNNNNNSTTHALNATPPSRDQLMNKREGAPFLKSLKPITAPVGSVGSPRKNKKFHKSESKKRTHITIDDVSDNIDARIDMEQSQSSSESNPNVLDAKKQTMSDVATNSKIEEAKSFKGELHQKIKLDALANKRQQRKHQVNLTTLSPGMIITFIYNIYIYIY